MDDNIGRLVGKRVEKLLHVCSADPPQLNKTEHLFEKEVHSHIRVRDVIENEVKL